MASDGPIKIQTIVLEIMMPSDLDSQKFKILQS